MKKIKYLIEIVFIVVLSSCNNHSKNYSDIMLNIIDSLEEEPPLIAHYYNISDYVEVSLNVYEAKSNIYQVLDSIINIVNSCPNVKNIQIGYDFIANYKIDTLKISIIAIDYLLNDEIYAFAHGLFFYKGYQFVYAGSFIDEFFVNTNETVKRFSIDTAKLSKDGDDSGYVGYWKYVYENNNLKNVYSLHCDCYLPAGKRYYVRPLIE